MPTETTEHYQTHIPSEHLGQDIIEGVEAPRNAYTLSIQGQQRGIVETACITFYDPSGKKIFDALTGLEVETCKAEIDKLFHPSKNTD